ncbi:uncharacterized protein PITG_01346 [Phytophthora infestans T30-4]|uniref:Uncharacterized protein n=1 Tax=Phytophthora infestans (strain T30-4) TaxID=403677 RepID=D0MVA4_PHYIT|nr:uncharacterized protein PITG_01346 [Phytophthora infestans T30-4]EEY61100.1 conserved hypothetical protein [Phytophthora infestans T30-4]|eukprot:XP_002908017.1 conserved hypothetical protein [Phytophthora infestans T30-4]
MDKYFTSHEIEMSTVFVCLCWIKSAGALQGDGGLSRNTSLTLKHTADLLTRINVSLNDHLAAINPLVAGLTMLDHHLEYLDLASEAVATSKLRSFCHVIYWTFTEK